MSMAATGKTIRTTQATGIMRDAELHHDNLGCWVLGLDGKYATIPLQVISRLKQLAGEQKRSSYSSRSCKALNA